MTVTALNQNPDVTGAKRGDVRAEFQALRTGCGLYELSDRARIAVTGSDRVRWLNGMVTNNIRDLAAGCGVYAFLLNPQGRIQADLYAYNRGDSLLIEIEQPLREKVLGIFDHYIIMDDVEVKDLGDKAAAIGVAGPRAKEKLRIVGVELPEFQPLQLADVAWQNSSVLLMRGDNPIVESFTLWLDSEQAGSLRDMLVKAGASSVGADALEGLRIASGIPRYGPDIRERDLPQETGQDRALNFSKGCYVGQEIVERIRSRGAVHRRFTGFEIEGQLPAPGTKVLAEGKDVGEITSAASLPLPDGDRALALGYIRREVGQPGKQVAVGEARARVAELPFKI